MFQLDDNARNVLRTLHGRGVVSGRALGKMTGLQNDDLVNSLKTLDKVALIDVSGSVGTSEAMKDSYITIRPSSARRADFFLQEKF